MNQVAKKFGTKEKLSPETYQQGKVYVNKADVWAIDYSLSREYMLVHCKHEQFKCKPEDLVFLEHKGGSDE